MLERSTSRVHRSIGTSTLLQAGQTALDLLVSSVDIDDADPSSSAANLADQYLHAQAAASAAEALLNFMLGRIDGAAQLAKAVDACSVLEAIVYSTARDLGNAARLEGAPSRANYASNVLNVRAQSSAMAAAYRRLEFLVRRARLDDH